jgi:hypothetical protein
VLHTLPVAVLVPDASPADDRPLQG